MGSDHRHPPPLLLLALLLTVRCASAQPPNNNNNNNNPYFANNFNPSMAIVIVVLISAFFFLGFFSIYIRQCAGDRRDVSARASAATAAHARSRRQRGIDADLLASFPTLVYSDVKAHKIGKGSLECAVCLSEFEDDETLRLLPQCSHVFHTDCIDAWLSAHVTCPVCRTNLTDPIPTPPTAIADPQQIQEPPQPEPTAIAENQVVIEIDASHQLDEDERKAEIANLENFVNMKRARSRARPARFPRSHSTGHSVVLPGENLDRFTLRLPENIRREIVSRAERLQRTTSCVVAFPSEGSSRRGYRGGEGSSRGTRSIRLGRSGRWGSSLLRTLSMRVPNWGRRGGGGADEGSMSMKGEGSVTKGGGLFKGGDSMKGEGSMRRFNAVIAPFDCYGGGAAKNVGFDVKDTDSQSSTAALNRV